MCVNSKVAQNFLKTILLKNIPKNFGLRNMTKITKINWYTSEINKEDLG